MVRNTEYQQYTKSTALELITRDPDSTSLICCITLEALSGLKPESNIYVADGNNKKPCAFYTEEALEGWIQRGGGENISA